MLELLKVLAEKCEIATLTTSRMKKNIIKITATRKKWSTKDAQILHVHCES